jgi:hypothetical protein
MDNDSGLSPVAFSEQSTRLAALQIRGRSLNLAVVSVVSDRPARSGFNCSEIQAFVSTGNPVVCVYLGEL